MAAKRDYYEILGVPRSATFEDLTKTSPRARSPPPPGPGAGRAEEGGRGEVQGDLRGLRRPTDPQKRATYDQQGHAGIDQQYAAEDIFRGADFGSVFQDMGDFGIGENLFESLFGGLGFDISGGRRRRGRAANQRGRDLQITIAISLEEAARGAEKTIAVPRYETCPTCGGSGARPGTQRTACPQCQGSGRVTVATGGMRLAQPCPRCGGTGTTVTSPCPDCGGEGRTKVKGTIKVKFPAGVDTGSSLRVRGEGEAGTAGTGDLYVLIEVQPHPVFKRDDNNLVTEMTISLSQAVLGGQVEVPTLDGGVKMKIPGRHAARPDLSAEGARDQGPPRQGSGRPACPHQRRHPRAPLPRATQAHGGVRQALGRGMIHHAINTNPMPLDITESGCLRGGGHLT